MKKCTLSLTACLLLFITACRKNDCLPKTLCQIKTIENDFGDRGKNAIHYFYNGQRLLTNIEFGLIKFSIQYNNKLLPVSVEHWVSPTSHTNLIYQNGHVVRLDDTDNSFSRQAFLKYDNHGRLIESRGVSISTYVLRWTYEDNSNNPKQKTWLFPLNNTRSSMGQDENLFADVIETLYYDNKINPEATFRNLELTPLNFGNAGLIRMEPIPDNNVVRKMIQGRTLSDSIFHKGQDIYTAYEYHNGYPVKAHVKRYMFPDGVTPVLSDTTQVTYIYECVER